MRRAKIVQMNFELPIKLTKRKNWIVAYCPVLDVVSQGSTERKAKKNLIEALTGFIESCLEHGTLEEVLKNCGFKFANKVTVKNSAPTKDEQYVKVPIPLIIEQTPHNSCHA